MKFLSIIVKAIKKLKPIIDVIVKGREAGLWNQKPGPHLFVSESAETVKVQNGMSHLFAGLWTVAIGLAVSAAQGLDYSLLLSDPKAFAVSFLAAFLAGWSLYLQRPGQASVMLGSSSEVRKEAETVTRLKLDVPIRPDGGK